MNTLLNRIGEALYGEHWQTPLGEALDVHDRTIRRWIAGETELPLGVWKELFIRLDVKRDEISFLITATKEKMDVGSP